MSAQPTPNNCSNVTSVEWNETIQVNNIMRIVKCYSLSLSVGLSSESLSGERDSVWFDFRASDLATVFPKTSIVATKGCISRRG